MEEMEDFEDGVCGEEWIYIELKRPRRIGMYA